MVNCSRIEFLSKHSNIMTSSVLTLTLALTGSGFKTEYKSSEPLKTLVMTCYDMLCYVMSCDIMLCYVMLWHVTLRFARLCYVMLCYVILRDVYKYFSGLFGLSGAR